MIRLTSRFVYSRTIKRTFCEVETGCFDSLLSLRIHSASRAWACGHIGIPSGPCVQETPQNPRFLSVLLIREQE